MNGIALASDWNGSRTYLPSRSWTAGMIVLVILSSLPGGLGMWYFTLGPGVRETRSPIVLVCIAAMFLTLGLALLANLKKTKLVLAGDSIAMHDLFSIRQLRRDEIKGYRIEIRSKGTSSTVFVPLWENRRSLSVPHIFDFDATYRNWLGQFPNLGLEEAAAAEVEMENNPALGATPGERQRSLHKARLCGRVLSIAAVLASAWGWFYPAPYRAVIMVLSLLPWLGLALAMRYRGLFRVDAKQNDPRPSIALPILFPGLVLALRVLYDVHLLGWQRPLLVAIFIDLLLCLAAMKLDPTLAQKKQVVLLFLISIGYGFGVGLEANALFDRSVPQVFPTRIVRKRISRGKTTSYYLTLTSWGPIQHDDEVMVMRGFYESMEPGKAVCVISRPGALGMPWYVVRRCR